MSISDKIREKLESNSTSGSILAKASLGLAVLCFQGSSAQIVQSKPYTHSWGNTQTNPRAITINVSDTAIVNEFKRIYEELAGSQVRLPSADSQLLHDNLWDLYA